MDEFEQFLKKQTVRTVPPTWRSEILIAAEHAARGREAAPAESSAAWWREWLWPSPVAWAGLACVWLVVIALNTAAAPMAKEEKMARRLPSQSPQEIAAALAEQRRELAQLFEPPAPPPVAVRRPDPPDPRSEFIVTTREA
jgi:hypothetical protein